MGKDLFVEHGCESVRPTSFIFKFEFGMVIYLFLQGISDPSFIVPLQARGLQHSKVPGMNRRSAQTDMKYDSMANQMAGHAIVSFHRHETVCLL